VSPFDRPNLGPWLCDPAKVAQYDGVIVSKLDRLSRGRDWQTREWAEEHGKKLIVVSPELVWPPEPGDTATAIVWDTLLNIASAEWQNTSQRYRRMQAHLRSKGAHVGSVPFGYRITGEEKAKQLVPDPTEADTIRAAVALYLGGKSLRAVCAYLDGTGVRPKAGGPWFPKSLSWLFRNPILVGRHLDASGKTVLRVPPILDRATWDALQTEMDRKANRKGVVSGSTAMLTGIAVCVACGGPMYFLNSGNRRQDGTKVDHKYYRCAGTPKEHSKCRNLYPAEELEERVDRFMTRTLGRWPRYETVVTPGSGYEDEIAEVERDLRELDFDDPGFVDKQAVLLAERARLRALPGTPATAERRPTGDTIGEHWATLETQADKRAFLLKLGMVIRVQRGWDARPATAKRAAREGRPELVAFEGFTGDGFDRGQFLGGELHLQDAAGE
jgi:hypothetical protein